MDSDTMDRLDLERFALGALRLLDEVAALGPRTKAHAVAWARYEGMTDALFRLGLGPGSAAIHLALLDAQRAAPPAPARDQGSAGGMEPYRRWEAMRAFDAAGRLLAL